MTDQVLGKIIAHLVADFQYEVVRQGLKTTDFRPSSGDGIHFSVLKLEHAWLFYAHFALSKNAAFDPLRLFKFINRANHLSALAKFDVDGETMFVSGYYPATFEVDTFRMFFATFIHDLGEPPKDDPDTVKFLFWTEEKLPAVAQ